jgi:hypothetical protein
MISEGRAVLWDVHADIPVRRRLTVPSWAGHASGRARMPRKPFTPSFFLPQLTCESGIKKGSPARRTAPSYKAAEATGAAGKANDVLHSENIVCFSIRARSLVGSGHPQ